MMAGMYYLMISSPDWFRHQKREVMG